jgi:hypothetical protein
MTADTPGPPLHLFISYARADRERLLQLRAVLKSLHHEVRVDDRLTVGQEWWNEICQQIRNCDVMVVALSPALVESQASINERDYARALGKVLLPVLLRPVRPESLPPDLALLLPVDYTEPGVDADSELAEALDKLPASPALPEPLPPTPELPMSYLSSLSAPVRAETLSREDQLALVSRLRAALDNEGQRDTARELLRVLHSREDLYSDAGREIEAIGLPEERYARAASSDPIRPLPQAPSMPPLADHRPKRRGGLLRRWASRRHRSEWATDHAAPDGVVGASPAATTPPAYPLIQCEPVWVAYEEQRVVIGLTHRQLSSLSSTGAVVGADETEPINDLTVSLLLDPASIQLADGMPEFVKVDEASGC